MNMTVPPLETERLLVRPYTMDDLPNVPQCSDPDRRREWLEWTVRNYQQLAGLYQPPYGDRAVVLKEAGVLIGSVGYVPSWGPFQRLPSFRQAGDDPASPLCTPEMGLFWTLAPEHRGRGYATEAARALIGFAFTDLQARRVVATTEHDNLPSQAVMRRLGMTLEANPLPEPEWFQVVGVLHNTIG